MHHDIYIQNLIHQIVKEQSHLQLKDTLKDTNVHFEVTFNGGARRDRTADPLLAKQVLSQLSYGPIEAGENNYFGGSGKI